MIELRDGRYALLRKLGEGSQGETWEAVDRGTAKGRTGSLGDQWKRYVAKAGETPRAAAGEHVVAIKAFRLDKAKAWKDVELAEREARTLASLDHRKLPRYVEHFEEDGALYLVMEKIEGESLASIRKRGGTLGPGEIVRLLEDGADALGYLHAHAPAIVHRDIKPGNVIRRSNGSFAIVDFGAVRDAALKPEGGSTVVGTFGYMAPEQFQGRASPKSDVYGLGATALAMLTGCEPEKLPHEGLALDVARAVPPGTPPELVAALEAMLDPDPDRRASSVLEALALLEEAPRKRPKRRRESKKNREQRRREAKVRRAEKAPIDEPATARAPMPLVGRTLARLGLLLALIAVWLFVGIAVPFVLTILSLAFGPKLRLAAKRAVDGAKSASAAIGRASARVSGRVVPPAPRLRIRTDLDRARAVTEPEAQRIAIDDAESQGEDADAWLEDKIAAETRRWEEEERKRARMRTHARPPPKGKHWGR